MSDADIQALIAQAIFNPASVLPRGESEHIIAWQARAVHKALKEKGIIKP